MAIPDYQSVMLPLLHLLGDGTEHRMRDAVATLSDQFGLTEAEKKEQLPSGNLVFENRVYWARAYLKKAALVLSPKWGFIQITDRGKKCLSESPHRIDVPYLKQFPEFLEYYTGKRVDDENATESQDTTTETPEELVATGYQKLRRQIETELLSRVKLSPPEFFERLVVRLLTAMGYGGSIADAGKAIGKTGDGGVDGVIKEDRLGLSLLFIQAKRWDTTSVGRPEVQGFVGALYGKKAKKGVFITTSTFTKDARDYAEGLDSRVILIDGAKLAEFMFDFNIGAVVESSYLVKRIDSDFFEDDSPPAAV